MKYYFITLFMSFQFLAAQNIPMYVGTYTNAESKGIYYYDFNIETGKLSNKKLAAEIENPSFLAFSTNKKLLYAVGEVNNFDSNSSGTVNAYAVTENGTLQFINKVSSNGAHPCHISLNNKNKTAAVSNYTGGTISIHKVDKNGNLNEAFQVINHNLDSVKSHAHSAKFLNNNLFVADLGRDILAQYVENNNQQYVLEENYTMKSGTGPRHFEITKDGAFIYVINELNSTVSVLKNNGKSYYKIQNISTLSDGYEGENSCADIHLSKNQTFLYGSNRGENTIVVYKRNIENGTLEKIQSVSVEGNWPRNFAIGPNGKFLLVANQRSNNISIFKIDQKLGKLSFLYNEAFDSPVCLLF